MYSLYISLQIFLIHIQFFLVSNQNWFYSQICPHENYEYSSGYSSINFESPSSGSLSLPHQLLVTKRLRLTIVVTLRYQNDQGIFTLILHQPKKRLIISIIINMKLWIFRENFTTNKKFKDIN